MVHISHLRRSRIVARIDVSPEHVKQDQGYDRDHEVYQEKAQKAWSGQKGAVDDEEVVDIKHHEIHSNFQIETRGGCGECPAS